ncbi:MAG: metallophosphoesterase [Clostridiales bacterium]|nr:metallophosphoesterase [Clostridiales bacterium]
MGPFIWILVITAGIILTAIIVYGILCLIEPHKHIVTHVTLAKNQASSGGKIRLKCGEEVYKIRDDIPSRDNGIRIFFFSDIHIETCFISAEKICRHIEEEHGSKPLDAVIFGGDIVTFGNTQAKGYRYLKKISDTCSTLGIPFLAVTGNHDTELPDQEVSRECSMELIEGTYKIINCASGASFVLCGIDDSGRENRVWYPMPEVPAELPVILIAHDPDSILHTGDRLPDYMLSGHTHGGQLKLPFGLRIAPRHKNELPSAGIVAGAYSYRSCTFYISRGIGCGYLPIRFGSVPEITVLDILP